MSLNFSFDGSMSRDVLESYLSRAVTHTGLCYDNFAPSRTFSDDMRMLLREGAKFVGRAGLIWQATDEEKHRRTCRERARIIHESDPDIILQGCIFECIWKPYIDSLPIPEWVFTEFSLPAEKRCFCYDDMLFPDGTYVDHWGKQGGSVEDIRRRETQMYFYYRARCYIDDGFEALHFGQVHLIGAKDPGFRCWRETLDRIRAYAHRHARRHFVLCDAHTHGIVIDGESLFDYNAWPLRLREDPGHPMRCSVEAGYLDSIYLDSRGGRTPSGWSADSLPYFVEVDNFGRLPQVGTPTLDTYYVWGYDEIDWLMLQTREERSRMLREIHTFLSQTDPGGHLEMPSRRCLTESYESIWLHPDIGWLEACREDEFLSYTLREDGAAVIRRRYYSANNPSSACPFGLGDEETIVRLFHSQTR
ncbi:MAG: hypothetical protein IJ865_09335 [Clostridia bacterium]|nr:hypothetical protein [Clostridia bacterium]